MIADGTYCQPNGYPETQFINPQMQLQASTKDTSSIDLLFQCQVGLIIVIDHNTPQSTDRHLLVSSMYSIGT